jgi:hypothetical protein
LAMTILEGVNAVGAETKVLAVKVKKSGAYSSSRTRLPCSTR